MKENRIISDIDSTRKDLGYVKYLIKLKDEYEHEREVFCEFNDWDTISDHWDFEHDTAFSTFKDRYNINYEEDLEELLDFFYTDELLEFFLDQESIEKHIDLKTEEDLFTIKDYNQFRKKIIKSYHSLSIREEELYQLHKDTYGDKYIKISLYNKLVKRPTISYLNRFIAFFENIDAFYRLRHRICEEIIHSEK